MEQQFQIKTSEYVNRLRAVGMLFLVGWTLIYGALNTRGNLRAFSGLDHVSEGYVALLYFFLLLYVVLSLCILEFILIRSAVVLALNSNAKKYKVTFMVDGIHIHLPCAEQSYFVPYKEIKYWGFQGSTYEDSITFFVESKQLKDLKGRISVYLDSSLKKEVEKACKKFAVDIKIKNKKEHPTSTILTLIDVTEVKNVK